MKLGFDLDGVLYPWQELAYEYLVLEGKTDLDAYTFWSTHVINDYNEMFLHNLLSLEFLYSQFIPNKEMLSTLRKLAEKFEICYVTARRNETLGLVTREYLRKYSFPNYEEIYFDNIKTDTIRLLELDYYVEDQIKHAIPISKLCKVFLKSAPYNHELNDDNITRIYNIRELLTLI